MTFRVLGLLLVLSIGCLGAHTQTSSGDDDRRGANLYHSCQATIRIMDAPNANAVANDDYAASEFCRGYFIAFADYNDVMRTAICPDEATLGTTVRVYLAYMDKNPKLMDKTMIAGVIGALRESYPCPERK